MEIQFKTKETNYIEFDVKDCDVSFANALRRIILSEIDSYAFETSSYTDSSIKIIENTSSLHNEFILHRIGLIPVYNITNETDYKFILNVQNKTNEIIDVTTKDIEVLNIQTNKKEDTLKFFPPNEITKDNILIIRLKPNPGDNGEKLHFEGTVRKGTGAENTRYSVVSNCVFINKVDESKYNLALQKHLTNVEPKNIDKETNTFEINERERHFYVDENGNPNYFEFKIESLGIFPSYIILKKALEKLITKINTFMINIKKTLNKQDSPISIKESPTVMKAMDIIIPNESHTLGFLVQSYIEKIESVDHISYQNPHPLKKEIFLRISTDKEIVTIAENVSKHITDMANQLIININKEFGITSKKKRIIKKKIKS